MWNGIDIKMIEVVITAFISVFASSGFWAFIMSNRDRESAEARMLRGLAHDRILYLGDKYIRRGRITMDEYENLKTYLYEPYEALGGNGSAKKIMTEVEKLAIESRKSQKHDSK